MLTFSDDAKNYIRLRKDGAIAFDRHLLLALGLTDLHLSNLIMTVLNFKDVFKLSCVTAAINVSSVGSPDIVNGIY